MHSPKISVIIPTYNGSEFVGEAIQSVLRQTYSNLDLIVIDDASTDSTKEVLKQFIDPRLRFLSHEENRGADRARHTGLQVSFGDLVAFLDQDDFFHPEKLQAHVEFYERYPNIGFTYNARFELNYSSKTIRDLWRPPHSLNLADLVLWFPLSPSDVVLKRKWALKLDLLNSRRGAEIYHFSRLFMDGCKFASVDRALNYRRYHSGRYIKDLSGGCKSELDNQKKVFADPRCPAYILNLRNRAHANIYMYWGYLAFIQEDTALGQELIRNAVRYEPSIIKGMPCELLNHFIINCIDDEGKNHAKTLETVLTQLPTEISQISSQYNWATGRGYLLKMVRAIVWDRPEDGRMHFKQAVNLNAQVDESFISTISSQLLNYEAEYGNEATNSILDALTRYLKIIGGQVSVRTLKGSYIVNRAFQYSQAGQYNSARLMALRAIVNNPKYLTNRGVLALLGQSILKSIKR